jgi:hypothetical protein
VTQPWIVIINGLEIHRANTWASCYDYITWHSGQRNATRARRNDRSRISRHCFTTLMVKINYQDKWLIFTRRGIDINAYPAIKSHLAQWQKELTPKINNLGERNRRSRGHTLWTVGQYRRE